MAEHSDWNESTERGGTGHHRPPESTEEARAHIEQSRRRIDEDLDAVARRVRERTDTLRRPVDRVRMNPWGSVAAAAGAGMVIGLLAGGRKDDREGRNTGKDQGGRGRGAARRLAGLAVAVMATAGKAALMEGARRAGRGAASAEPTDTPRM